MIKVNGEVVKIEKYPDGTPRINIGGTYIKDDRTRYCWERAVTCPPIRIQWKFESNDELFYLVLIKKHLEDNFGAALDTRGLFYLNMPYIPNARMDRVKSRDEVFTLKYFCDLINDLHFDYVSVLDAHSDVSVALLNKCTNNSPKPYIQLAMDYDLASENIIFYFPDAGAAKRYSGLFPGIPHCYGEKKRDWKTGKILGLEVKTNGLDLAGKDILMIDDIVAYGGSLYYSALELKKCGVNKIYAYATHTENSILDKEKGTLIKLLENGTVERLFTTNSLFTGHHEKITAMEVH